MWDQGPWFPSSLPQLPSRAAQGLSVEPLLSCRAPGQGAGHWGCALLGTLRAPVLAQGLVHSLPLTGRCGLESNLTWLVRGTPLNCPCTQSSPSAPVQPAGGSDSLCRVSVVSVSQGRSAGPGGALRLRGTELSQPRTPSDSPWVVFVSHVPPRARPGGAVNVTMLCNAATGATRQ